MKRSIAQLKEWFSRGKYPTGAQFADWLESYIHKDEAIGLTQVEGLTERLNGKLSLSRGEAVETEVANLRSEFEDHEETSGYEIKQLKSIARSHGNDLSKLNSIIKISDAAFTDSLVWEGVYKLQNEETATEETMVVTTRKASSLGTIDFYDVVQYRFGASGLEQRKGSHRVYTETADGEAAPDMTIWEKWHVVDELGEQIPKEHVKVTCRFCDNETRGRSAGAYVYVYIFSTTGYPAVHIKQKYKADANGIVEFDVPCGLKYAIYSKFEGLSASFQWVYLACNETRNVDLWNLKIGIGWLVSLLFSSYPGGEYTSYAPVILNHYSDYNDGIDEIHAAGNALDDISIQEQWEYNEYYCDMGAVIATEDTCFVIPTAYDITSPLCIAKNVGFDGDIGPLITLAEFREDIEWRDFIASDINGNLNTEKIINFYRNSPAAEKVRGEKSNILTQSFIPAYVQALLIAQNYKALNAIFEEANAMGEDFDLIPDVEANKENTTLETWWTSTPYFNRFATIYLNSKINQGSSPINVPHIIRVVASADIYYEGYLPGLDDI